MFDVDNARFRCLMHNIHKYTKTHPDQINFALFFFSIVNMSTRWCSHHRINYKSHRGGCGTSATTTMKPFPILRSLKKNDKHMAQISFCQQQLAHIITPASLSSAIQTSLTWVKITAHFLWTWRESFWTLINNFSNIYYNMKTGETTSFH